MSKKRPNVFTVTHREFTLTVHNKDGQREVIATGVKGTKYEGIKAAGRNEQQAYEGLLDTYDVVRGKA